MVGHGVEQSFMQRNDFTAQIGIIKIKTLYGIQGIHRYLGCADHAQTRSWV